MFAAEPCRSHNKGRTIHMLQAQEEMPPAAYAVDFDNGKRQVNGDGAPSFTLSLHDPKQLEEILSGDDYTAAMAFVRGEFDISGDLVAAMRLKHQRTRSRLWSWLRGALERIRPTRLETWFQTRGQASRNIRFHYDRSNDF